jgi:hypothetical protein
MGKVSTPYRVRERMSDGYHNYVCDVTETGYRWARDIKQAEQFIGRKAAERALLLVLGHIRAAGYEPHRLEIVPARGGAACTFDYRTKTG